MRIEIVPGDITAQSVDVVVNAVNASLLGAGVFGRDVAEVARIAVAAVREVADEGGAGNVEKVRFVPFGAAAPAAFAVALAADGRG